MKSLIYESVEKLGEALRRGILMKEKIRSEVRRMTFMKKTILILTGIYVLGISSILRANFYYIDDIGRATRGYKQWDHFGRYLSYYLSSFIHGDSYLTDVSPLPQLIAAVLMAIAGTITLYVISGKKRYTFLEYVAVISMGLSPYFLECFSYKYDSTYMALSVLAGVFPLLFCNAGYIAYSIISVLSILAVCMTYQASSGIFPMLVLLLSFKRWNKREDKKEIFKFIVISAVTYIIGLIVFLLIFVQPGDTYVSTSLSPLNQIFLLTVKHLKEYISLIISDFKMEWLILYLLMCIVFVGVAVKTSSQKKYFACLVAPLLLILMTLVSFGVYPVLSKPLFAPRAMYGFGILIAFIGVFIASTETMRSCKLVGFLLNWAFFVFAFTYGNALDAQSAYTDLRISAVIEDLNDLESFSTDEKITVQISGSIGLAPILKNMPQDYQMLKRLVPVMFQEKWYWGLYGFYNCYGLKNVKKDTSIDLVEQELPILKDTMYHRIRGRGNYILVELK